MTPDPLTPRIYTKCPACGNDTLTVNDDRHLICTWISCPDPTLIDRISEVFPTKWEEAQRANAEMGAALEKIACHFGIEGTAEHVAQEVCSKTARDQILAKTEELGWSFQEPFINHLDVISRRRRRGLNETQLKFWMAVADERQLQEAYDDTINLLNLSGEIPLET